MFCILDDFLLPKVCVWVLLLSLPSVSLSLVHFSASHHFPRLHEHTLFSWSVCTTVCDWEVERYFSDWVTDCVSTSSISLSGSFFLTHEYVFILFFSSHVTKAKTHWYIYIMSLERLLIGIVFHTLGRKSISSICLLFCQPLRLQSLIFFT